MVGARTGGCFMMIGSDDGSGVPVSFSFISFIATENSSRSIFPSLFISARVLGDRTHNISKETVMASQEDPLKHSILSTVREFVCVSLTIYQPTLMEAALTEGKASLPGLL